MFHSRPRNENIQGEPNFHNLMEYVKNTPRLSNLSIINSDCETHKIFKKKKKKKKPPSGGFIRFKGKTQFFLKTDTIQIIVLIPYSTKLKI
jgi:hypothetical protein